MWKKVKYSILLITSLFLLNSCQSTNNSASNWAEKVSVTFGMIPDGYMETRNIQLPERQQYCFKNSEDEIQRFVLEVQKENKDESDGIDKKMVSIDDMEGEYYIYHGEKLKYTGMEETEIQEILKMEKEENVLEWTQNNVFCRIYGTLSLKELLEIAENVEVNYE